MADQAEPATPAAPSAADTSYDPTPQPDPTPEPTPAESEPSKPADAPWAQSLSSRFEDEAVRDQVDSYLREEIQPYITYREQQLGQVGEVWEGLWDGYGDDEADPSTSLGTYLALTEARFGPEVAQAVAQSLAGQFGEEPQEDPESTDVGPPQMDEWLQGQPEEVQAYFRQQLEQQEDAEYEQLLTEVAQHEPTVKGNEELFSRYVLAADSIEEAVEMWQAEMAPRISQHPELFGAPPPAESEPAPAQAAAPEVLGTGATAGVSAPPTTPEADSLDTAVDLFFKDLRGQGSGGL